MRLLTRVPHVTGRPVSWRPLAVTATLALLVSQLGPAPLRSVAGGDIFDTLSATVASAQSNPGVELGPPPQVTDSSVLQPTVSAEPKAGAFAVNTMDRTAVVNLYNTVLVPALAVPAGWTGSIAGCVAGTNSDAYQAATISTVNYFRAMAGLPDNVTLDTARSVNDQQAALMMIASGRLSHFPDPTFTCYTPSGAVAAGTSNLALGTHGPAAVMAYVADEGTTNTAVGHRRWILYPPQTSMGTGSTTATNGGFTGSNDLDVIGSFGIRPASPEFVAWPPQGFIPFQITPTRWSFSYPSADFSLASVTMTQGATPISVVVQPIQNGFGDNTIVWAPTASFGSGPDTTYTVNVSNVRVFGVPRNFTYTVTVIDPSLPGGPTPTPTSTGGPIGGKGFALSSDSAGVHLSWNSGTGQTGYLIARLRMSNGTLAILPSTPLPSSAISFVDTSPPADLDCYAVLPLGPSPQQISDVLCALVGFHTPTGAPQNFTVKLNQSNVTTLTWNQPVGDGQDGYLLVTLGGLTQPLAGTIQSTLAATNGFTCYALAAVHSGTLLGYTDIDCVLPGVANLHP